MAIDIPNLKLKKILELLLSAVRADYAAKVDKTETWLYRVFNGITYGSFDFYTQAINIIVGRGVNHPNQLLVQLGFNIQKPEIPTIHINVPSEVPAAAGKGVNGIGFGIDTNEYYENSDDTYNDSTRRGYDGSYELIITSANEFESELIYRFLQAIFQSSHDTLINNFNGVFSFQGKSVMVNPELSPVPLFMRVLVISLAYDIVVPQLSITEYLGNVDFHGTPFEDEITSSEETVNLIDIQLSLQDATLIVGGIVTLNIIYDPIDATNKNISWVSSDPSIASVNVYGVVTGVSVGTCTITATSEEGSYTDSVNIIVE